MTTNAVVNVTIPVMQIIGRLTFHAPGSINILIQMSFKSIVIYVIIYNYTLTTTVITLFIIFAPPGTPFLNNGFASELDMYI